MLARLLWILLWPLRLPFMLLRRGVRGARGVRAADAAAAGGASKLEQKSDHYDRRYSGIWQVFTREPSDETIIRADEHELAAQWAQKALKYFSHRLELFPAQDFYEEVERDHFITHVAQIETEGQSNEDQFIRLMRQGREIANANARTLFCEFAPLTLAVILTLQVAVLLFNPFGLLTTAQHAVALQGALADSGGGIVVAVTAAGLGLLFIVFIYRFSFTHVQRQNAQEMNSFIQTEFTSLNQSFNVARAECMQAETRFDSTQHDKVEPRASAWALTYHWIAIRQFAEELCIRNNLFQVRRNTWLYKASGFIICTVLSILAVAGVYCLEQTVAVATPVLPACLYVGAVGLVFLLVAYVLIMREPFSIFASRLPKDEWSRFDKLRVGDAIAEQVARDKKQIVIQRDRRGG